MIEQARHFQAAMEAADPARVIAAAREWIGTPYHDQASIKGIGCDCLGLARGVWRDVVGPEPQRVPPYSRDWGEVGNREVLLSGALRWMLPCPPFQRAPGDLVLFRMRQGAIAKHCGILTSDSRFVHSYERGGVVEAPLTGAWRRRIAFALRFPKEAR
ncbi:NlpC/P60 family protein [Parvibaculum sedimenti]|nr:NlpC/P60 family protein [Parvibaculum sedimenti]